jgi:uncharacterized protein
LPYYADSSAVLKLAVNEQHADAMRGWAHTLPEPLVVSDLGMSECIRAARRLDAKAVEAITQVLASCDLIALPRRVFAAAAALGGPAVRMLDALHLAMALELGSDLTGLVTYDERMLAAAVALGVQVTAPGRAE